MNTPKPPPPMDSAELSAALDAIGWSASELARRVTRSRQFVQKCRDGEKPVPVRIAEYVRAVRRAFERVPIYKDPDPSGLGADELERVRGAVLEAAPT